VGTFLGVFSFNKIQDEFQSDIDKRLEFQKKEMDSLERKLARNQEALKYTTRVFVVENLEFPSDKFSVQNRNEAFTLYFRDLITIHGENLPNFTSTPMITLEGKGILLDIAELTTKYIKIGAPMKVLYGGDEERDFYHFDMWIAEPN